MTHLLPAHGIDELMARDGTNPRRERKRWIPSMTFQVNGQQNLLHDIFNLCVSLPRPAQAPPNRAPESRCQLLQQFAISSLVAGHRAAHQQSPGIVGWSFRHAAIPMFESKAGFVTGCLAARAVLRPAATFDHEDVSL